MAPPARGGGGPAEATRRSSEAARGAAAASGDDGVAKASTTTTTTPPPFRGSSVRRSSSPAARRSAFGIIASCVLVGSATGLVASPDGAIAGARAAARRPAATRLAASRGWSEFVAPSYNGEYATPPTPGATQHPPSSSEATSTPPVETPHVAPQTAFSDPVATELALLRINSLFYSAFRNGDFERLAATLHPDDAVSVIHPGIPPLYGRKAVLQSWRSVMRAPPQIWPSEARVVQIHENVAWLHCFETLEGARGVRLAATNIFKRDRDGYWRMVMHQAGAC